MINRPVTRVSSRIFCPNLKYRLNIKASSISAPKIMKSALQSLDWKVVMTLDFEALTSNATWTLSDRSPTDNVIHYHWVFKVKQREDGIVERHKARLVANGML